MSWNNSKKAMVMVTVLVIADALLVYLLFSFSRTSVQTPRPATILKLDDVSHEATATESAPFFNGSQQLPSTLQHYVSRIFSRPAVDMDSENFTIVMMTYKRTNVLFKILGHYCKTPRLQEIVVIWNNVHAPVPENLQKLPCEVPLKFIQETENRMTNRFKPRPEFETECIAIIDDDRLFTEQNDITFGFRVWQQFRHRIIGFEHRTHVELPGGKYYYDVDQLYKYQGYSLMIGATLLFHKAYLDMFQDPKILPREMFEYIDKLMNCDDIGICVMVAKFLEDVAWPQCSVLTVAHAAITNLEDKGSEGFQGLSQRSNHNDQRTECLNKFTDFYGNPLPLHYENIIVHE